MDTLIKLLDYGQSYWLDNLSREKINSGELEKRVSAQGLRGITSNPSIFYEAISGGSEYDAAIKDLVQKGNSPGHIYDALTIKDVQDACDILLPVHKSSKGTDGFVSLEVPPALARDTEGTIKEARRLFKAVNRKNCMIKIPGTLEGLPAIEQTLYEGININITLLFSVKRYKEVGEAYIRAMKRRLKEGKKISHVISVASFFLSRIDTFADEILSQYITDTRLLQANNETPAEDPASILGKTGTASAVMAYQVFKELFHSGEWKKLEKSGAHVQRVLWASTSNKNPLYDDLRYVEPLIGADTVNTLPDKTITIFEEKGKLAGNTIDEGVAQAKQTFRTLKKVGINIDMLTQQLENEGVKKFAEAYEKLMNILALKRMAELEGSCAMQAIQCKALEADWKAVCTSLNENHAGRRLFAKDVTLWNKTDKAQIQTIREGLGWLTLPNDMLGAANKFAAFAAQIKEEGYTSVVLLGMGGSSLCSEVARETFGSVNGYPKLYVLDNTAPDAIRDIEEKTDIRKTLFIVASKSGSTLETNCFFHYFYEKLNAQVGKIAGKNFVAITDKDTSLVKLASQYKFRKVFINAPDVGGRYSVLSDFGILPMALVGIDVQAILKNAQQMMICCGPDVPAMANPGISLGALLGIAQRKGRDKITFVLSSSLESFGFWVEQLLAESTGKEGKGVIPVNGEELDGPGEYANDRVFVHMYLTSDSNQVNERKLKALEDAGHPVVRIAIPNKIALGGVYYLWEIATAIAGLIIGINPFDQPNVAESKTNTNNLLAKWIEEGSFKELTPMFSRGEIKLFGGEKVKQLIQGHAGSVTDFISSFLSHSKQDDYIALLPYFMLTYSRTRILQDWRETMKSESKEATTLLNGPRYLHSTGQLHKGGPGTGLYILLMADDNDAMPIPGQKYSFSILHRAQALGDFRSLSDKGRRVILIDLGKNIDKGMENLWNSIRSEEPVKMHQF